MVHTLLVRGMLVGILAGLRVFAFAKVFGEPQVDRAIAFETAMDEAKMKADLAKGIHHEEEPELVSRPMQASWGLLTGVTMRRPLADYSLWSSHSPMAASASSGRAPFRLYWR